LLPIFFHTKIGVVNPTISSADNILRRRAQRLRKLTGATNIKSKSEIEQEKLKASEVFWDAIIKPIEIMVKDPAVAFTNIYVSTDSLSEPQVTPNKIADFSYIWHILLVSRSSLCSLSQALHSTTTSGCRNSRHNVNLLRTMSQGIFRKGKTLSIGMFLN
jgi:hypothetical protein